MILAGTIGHFIMIDVLTVHGRTGISAFIPHADLLNTMEKTAMKGGGLFWA
jgi:hypothetical protein